MRLPKLFLIYLRACSTASSSQRRATSGLSLLAANLEKCVCVFFFLKKRFVFYCLPSEVECVLCCELRPRLQAHDVALRELGHVQAVHLLESGAKIRE